MSTHTPGPWSAHFKILSGNQARGMIVRGSTGRTLADVNHDVPEYVDNGMVMAAAPAMLDELRNVLAQAESNPFLAVGMLLEHHSNIRAVVAMAEGRAP